MSKNKKWKKKETIALKLLSAKDAHMIYVFHMQTHQELMEGNFSNSVDTFNWEIRADWEINTLLTVMKLT